jgi:D-3-phosphoglycerate dehydrogenase / 2-oxoglutarate reductase
MSETYRILVADALSEKGIHALKEVPQFSVDVNVGLKEEQLLGIVADYDAILVRSATKINQKLIAAATRLKIVGRAGVGVDNVDVEAATERGIIVMNTPGGNTISTAEHAFTLMLSLARKIPQAHASIVAGKWDRKSFEGTEVCNKTLGIIGMGRIGGEFARRAIAFGMRVICFDPYLSMSRARALQVELVDNLTPLLREADFITLHTPLTPETKGVLNAKTLAECKKGVRLINCARGGLIDEGDLLLALESGQVAGAALDVYEVEPLPLDFPLRHLPNVVLTPHLGASTAEAQESVGIEIAEALRDALLQGAIRNAVNAPSVDSRTAAILKPYLILAEKLGLLLNQIGPQRVDSLKIEYCGKVQELDTVPITRAVLQGLLRKAGGSEVNAVNAPLLAKSRGISVTETKVSALQDFAELLTLEVSAGSEKTTVAATFYGPKPRIVMVNGHNLEATLEGTLFIMENKDRPGIVGWIGTILGKHQVNIASMSLSRVEAGSNALSLLNLDSTPPLAALQEIESDPDIRSVKLATL